MKVDLKGGYVMLDLASTNIYNEAVEAVAAKKPILVYDNGKCYYADTFEVDGDGNVVITKGGKTITIETDDVVSVGVVENPLMENIKDKNGNLRFIESDGISNEISGVTFNYNKASLSGTHFMCVLSITIENTIEVAVNTKLAVVNVPSYVYNKIVPLWSSGIDIKNMLLYASNGTSQLLPIRLEKSVNVNQLEIFTNGALTLSATRTGRVQFDLLIDAE